MRKLLLFYFIGITMGVGLSGSLSAQCTVTAYASPATINCGDQVTIYAVANPGSYVTLYENNFNTGVLGSGWTATSGGTLFNNPCGAGPAGSGTHVWFGSGSTQPRQLSSVGYDVRLGGRICFDMKYATQPTLTAPADCEGPDLPNEGVYLQYSINGGTSWNTIQYFNPDTNGAAGTSPILTVWRNYCYNIPPAALTASTRFRWYQDAGSGAPNDHWGIDNVRIELNNPVYKYIWGHTTVNTAFPGADYPVGPTKTYDVTYRDTVTGQQCTSKVTINVTMPTISATGSGTFCTGQTSSLNVTSSLAASKPTTCGISTTGCLGNVGTAAVGTGTQVNTSTTFPNVFGNYDNSGKHQILYTKADLNSAGFTGGQIKSIAFDVSSIPSGAATTYNQFEIRMKCSSLTAFPSGSGGWQTGLVTVFNSKTVNITTGWNTFNFDNIFDWDGNSNIVVQVCFNNGNSWTYNSITRNTATTFRSVYYYTTISTASPACGQATTGTGSDKRPNTRFGTCDAVVTVNYAWSPPTGLSSTSVRNPTATMPNMQNITYTVTVTDPAKPQCSVTTSVTLANCVTVPVTLLSFNGKARDAVVDLTWKTGTEENVREFRVERSEDGLLFTDIGGVAAANAPSDYRYTDMKPRKGINYYRLREIDMNGQIYYSGIIGIAPEPPRFSLGNPAPVPVKDRLSIVIATDKSEVVNMQILSVNGALIQQTEHLVSEENEIALDVSALPEGVYLLKVSNERGDTASRRFIK